MEVQILHAGIAHPSPYFYNFCNALRQIAPDIKLSVNPEIPSTSPRGQGILHFHRLKRFYQSDSQQSADVFIGNLKIELRPQE